MRNDMEAAYKIAAAAVRQRLAEQHPDDLAVLNSLRRDNVAVYKGSFDAVEKVLDCLRVPHRIGVDARKLRAAMVFVNCSSNYDNTLLEQIAGHVAKGAWLSTSDWALQLFLERVFPNTVRKTSRQTRDEVISVEPGLDSLWADVVVLGADPQWWLESSSYPIEVLAPDRVRIEAASHDLLVQYGAPTVAVSFDWHSGHVYHVISHYWHQRSRTPTGRYAAPGVEFLRAGMRLSEEGIGNVLRAAKAQPDTVNFAMLQTAATATELVAQLCVRAQRSATVSLV